MPARRRARTARRFLNRRHISSRRDATKWSYGISPLEQAAEALENGDEGSIWLNLSGAMGFGKMAGLPATEVERIRAAVDLLFER